MCLFELRNDVKAAIEVDAGQGWQVLYPGSSLTWEAPPPHVAARYRDDPDISGEGAIAFSGSVSVSEVFGSFAAQCACIVDIERRAVLRERKLRQSRGQKLEQAKVRALSAQQCRLLGQLCLKSGIPCGLLALCTRLHPTNWILVRLWLLAATVFFVISVCYAQFHVRLSWKLHDVILNGLGGSRGWTCMRATCTSYLYMILADCLLLIVIAFIIAVYVMSWDIDQGKALEWLAWICSPVSCVIGPYCIKSTERDAQQAAEGQSARELDNAREEACERSIVFEGRVLSSAEPCVCSWPGKYESAWDALVQGKHISAAVVFLPEGSMHYGSHDPVPSHEEVEGVREGGCWCVPIYGECKPWGCRWWTHWMANVKKAHGLGAELVVYYFANMRGQGKVQSFTTAGDEHRRRDELYRKKRHFENSLEVQEARAAGLKNLCKDKGEDSSSQYDREVHRLFLASLNMADRKFLEESEGLGNSQKAEVAWLDKQGYRYTEKEVRVQEWVRRSTVQAIEMSSLG